MPTCGDDVLITGIGCVGPLGDDAETFWKRLLVGQRGVRLLTHDDFHGIDVLTTGPPFAGAPAVDPKRSDCQDDPVLRLVARAAAEAFSHAGLPRDSYDPDRAGCVVGTSKGGLTAFARAFLAHRAGIASDDWLQVMPHVAAISTARRFDLRGPCLAPVAACATGLVSVLRALDLIRAGTCDLVVAGSGDASLHPAVLASFRRMGVLSSQFDEPSAACRPFNRDRNGFAVGEGSAVFVLERRTHARARGVGGIACVLGGAILSDPCGMTAVDASGASVARAIRDTLDRCGAAPRDVGHVNLHGTATRSNDIAEAAALRTALGSFADRVPCTAIKGAIGHQLGAAGATELLAAALTVRDGVLPPTANLTDLDPDCALDLSCEPRRVGGLGLKLSLGFGGHIAAALLGPA
jgi:3-oxoacyl-[acyl-carrier-protein] synthase II